MQSFTLKFARGIRSIVLSTLIAGGMMASAPAVHAQVRELPVAFDSTGKVDVITPPLAARLSLDAAVWPVTGDYLDARLYSLEDATRSFVLVVRRPQGTIERFPLDATRRAQLAGAVARGIALAQLRMGPDSAPMMVSEPVRGLYVVNQTALGAFLYGPAAAAITEDPAAGTAAYLLVAGGTFFLANNITKSKPVSRAQNHLSWHGALKGAAAANLALYALEGENEASDRSAAAVTLAGGVAGNVAGFILGKPMTDAEAHGTSYGITVAALMATGLIGSAGLFDDEGSSRVGAGLVIGAGTLGYPLGRRYVRRASYNVTAGDVGTLLPASYLGAAVAAIPLVDSNVSEEAASAIITAGYAIGLIAGDRFLVRSFDHTVAESRLLQLGTLAGGLIGVALPVAAQADDGRVVLGAATVGGFLGMLLTENQIAPRRAASRSGSALVRPTVAAGNKSRVDVSFSPTGLLFAGMGRRGTHPIVSAVF